MSCRYKCLHPRQVVHEDKLSCYCDVDCEFFKDCCADYDDFCGKNVSAVDNQYSNTTSNEELLQKNSSQGKLLHKYNRALWKCYEGETRKGTEGIWMIGSCPDSWPKDDVFYQCRNLSVANTITKENYRYLPVYTSNGTVYHNRFCAHCNGVTLQEVKSYSMSIKCDLTPPEHLNIQDKIAFLFVSCSNKPLWKPSKGDPRMYCLCFYNYLDRNCRSDIKTKCQHDPVRVVNQQKDEYVYKNINCAHCSSRRQNLDTSLLKCGPEQDSICQSFKILPMSFSVIFDFNSGASSLQTMKVEIKCPGSMVYDHYLEACLKTLSGRPTLSNVDHYQVVLWLKLRSSCRQCLLKASNVDKELARNLQVSCDQVFDSFLTESNFLAHPELHFKLKTNPNESLVTINMLKKILKFTSPFNLTIAKETLTVIKATIRKLGCKILDTYKRNEYTTTKSAVIIIKTGEVLQFKDYYTNPDGTSPNDSQVIFVCRQRFNKDQIITNCSFKWILLNEGEYVVLHNNSIFRNDSSKLYDWSQYIWQNGSLFVCENVSSTYFVKAPEKDDEVLAILTLVCMLISIVALVFVLVTYSLFVELRTPPGINLMNLSIAILLAQLLWILGSRLTDKPMACAIIAVLLHYFFLVSFVWTSIIAFDT